MAMSMDNLVKNLPLDVKSVQATLTNDANLRTLLYYCEEIEVKSSHEKIDSNVLIRSLLYQLLSYMILNEMGQAKYLWKRYPKELKADTQAISLWAIGQSIFKYEYNKAFEQIELLLLNDSVTPELKPFLNKLQIEYCRRNVNLVTLSYSSISIKELLGYVCNIKSNDISKSKDGNVSFVKKLINDYNLNDKWCLDEKTGIIEINNVKEEYDLDSSLMNDFTKYVCFMESIQNV